MIKNRGNLGMTQPYGTYELEQSTRQLLSCSLTLTLSWSQRLPSNNWTEGRSRYRERERETAGLHRPATRAKPHSASSPSNWHSAAFPESFHQNVLNVAVTTGCSRDRLIKSRMRWEGYAACMKEASWGTQMDFKIRLRWHAVDTLAQGRVLWRLLWTR